MFFSMGVLQIVIEMLAILLTLLLITFTSAFFYFCCSKLRNFGAAKQQQDKVLILSKQGWECEIETPSVFLVENEREPMREKKSEKMEFLQKKSDKLSIIIENLKVLQKKRDILRTLKKRNKNVYIVKKTGVLPEKSQIPSARSIEPENEKPGKKSQTSYTNLYENEREVLFDPKFAIPLWKYQELIEKSTI